MANLSFAKAVRRHVECPAADVTAENVAALFDAYFDEHPGVRSYVLDEQGSVRKHIAVFINDDLITDRTDLTDTVGADDRVFVFQALSGGSI